MKNATRCVLLALLFAGCRAPFPSTKDFSPYKGTRIEPPSTGSYGTADSNYYQAPLKSGQTPAANTRSDSSASPDSVVQNSESDASWKTPARTTSSPSRDSETVPSRPRSDVSTAAYEEVGSEVAAIASSNQKTTWQLIEASPAPAGSTASREPSNTRGIKMNGMPVNDATALEEPAEFQPRGPVRDISELPEPTPAIRARIRRESSISTASSSSDSATSADNAGWRTR